MGTIGYRYARCHYEFVDDAEAPGPVHLVDHTIDQIPSEAEKIQDHVAEAPPQSRTNVPSKTPEVTSDGCQEIADDTDKQVAAVHDSQFAAVHDMASASNHELENAAIHDMPHEHDQQSTTNHDQETGTDQHLDIASLTTIPTTLPDPSIRIPLASHTSPTTTATTMRLQPPAINAAQALAETTDGDRDLEMTDYLASPEAHPADVDDDDLETGSIASSVTFGRSLSLGH